MKWVTGIFIATCALSAFAQGEKKDVFVTQMSSISEETALKDLPPHLKPEPGKLSLLADFQNQKEGRVRLYFVNATKKPTLLPKQDGDIYCKREAKGKDEEWRRCDSHEYSWCGNSYAFVEVKAGGVISWEQKLDSKGGKPRPLRFRLFNEDPSELKSNEGVGKVADEDITFCRYDAMAMSYGPFEDVAAVATGEVQGSSMGGNSGIRALQRFSYEEQLFPVLKKVVTNLLKQPDSEDRIANEYENCLGVLAKALTRRRVDSEAFEYVAGQVNDPTFPWSPVALKWLMDNFREKKEEKKALVEKMLSKPDHLALQSAIQAYGGLAEKDEAGPRLEAIAKDKRYLQADRDCAREARQKLFPNPYLRISIEETETFPEKETLHEGEKVNAPTLLPPAGNHEVAVRPLKTVTLANISPQALTLPVAKAEDLIIVQMIGDDNVGPPMPVAGSGQIHLKPGEKIVLHDVQWWRGIDPAKLNKGGKDPFGGEGRLFSFILHAATPGLWDVPAEGPTISVDGDKLLKVLQKNR